jgi:hypothetical protein
MSIKPAGRASFSSISRTIGRPHHQVRNDRRWDGRACVCAGGTGDWPSGGFEQPTWSGIAYRQGADLGHGASAATVGEAASLEYVLLAVPWPNIEHALRGLPAWNGRVLIDATNPFIEYSPKLVLADLGGKGASEVVAALAPGAMIAKAFNSIVTARFNEGPQRMVAAASSSSPATTRSRPNSS